jgi:threonine synthase
MTQNYTNTYIDTRGEAGESLTFTQAILAGIAPGGGLYVPKVLPRLTLDEVTSLAALPYAYQAAYLYRRFGVDLPADKVGSLMAAAYGKAFDTPVIAPVTTVAPGTHVLELWHGPTSAFKDMALQCLPHFFSAAIEQRRAAGDEAARNDYLILVATSGDTGKAALEGFKDRAHTGIVVFYPSGGVSDMQYLQMATQQGGNVGVFGVRGNFDSCQTSVKGAFSDEDFAALLEDEYGLKLSSANSINWGRLLPQVVYYVSAYAQLVAKGELAAGEELDVCVPTGNFGNILACYYAKEIGVPIGRMFCASNENRVLTDFINTGTYDISEREFVLTPSPSMDILVSSNLERQLFELSGRDAGAVAGWMRELRENKRFSVDRGTFERMRSLFSADWVSNSDSLAVIRAVFERYGYLLDPHTAVGWEVAERLRGENPVLVVATAHWAKFGADVYRALHGTAAGKPLSKEVRGLGGVELNRRIARETGVNDIPARLDALDEGQVRFRGTCDGTTDGVKGAVVDWLESEDALHLTRHRKRGIMNAMKHLDIQTRLTIYHTENDMDERSTFGKGIATLLRGVVDYGSLNAAAKHIHMAYSKAWRIVKETEAGFGFDVISRDGARGSSLTPEGQKLLDIYEKLEAEANESVKSKFTKMIA